MKRSRALRFLAFAFAVMLALSSCAQGASTSLTVATASTGEAEKTSASTKKPSATTEGTIDYEDITFFGKTFTIVLLTDYNEEKYRGVYAEENGEKDIYAVAANRNSTIESSHGAKIETVSMSLEALEGKLLAGEEIDFVIAPRGAVNESYCREVSTLGIDFSEHYFFESIIKGYVAHGDIYGISACFLIDGLTSADAIFFNKDVKNSAPSLKELDFYEYVYKNTWTVDKLLELSRLAALETGVCGFASEKSGVSALYFGMGQNYVSANESSEFKHGFGDAAYAVTDKLISLYGESSTGVFESGAAAEKLEKGEALFALGTLGDIEKYAAEKLDFGVLHLPKTGKSQKEYFSVLEEAPALMFALNTGKSPDTVGKFIWIYSYYSYFSVYENMLTEYKYRYTTDTDSSVIIDEIFKNVLFDEARTYNLAGAEEAYTSAVLAGENKTYELAASAGAELEKIMREKGK